MKDHLLLVEACNLDRNHVDFINQIALAYKMAGATVVFMECISPTAKIKKRQRLHNMGYGFDELIQVKSSNKEIYPYLMAREIVKAADANTLVLSGYPLMMDKLNKRGIRGLLYT